MYVCAELRAIFMFWLMCAAIALEDVWTLCGAEVHARVSESWDESIALEALALEGPSVTCAFCHATFQVNGARPPIFTCVMTDCKSVTCVQCAISHTLPIGTSYCSIAAAAQEAARQAAARERLREQQDAIIQELERLIQCSQEGTFQVSVFMLGGGLDQGVAMSADQWLHASKLVYVCTV
jgi:hypothetical protein